MESLSTAESWPSAFSSFHCSDNDDSRNRYSPTNIFRFEHQFELDCRAPCVERAFAFPHLPLDVQGTEDLFLMQLTPAATAPSGEIRHRSHELKTARCDESARADRSAPLRRTCAPHLRRIPTVGEPASLLRCRAANVCLSHHDWSAITLMCFAQHGRRPDQSLGVHADCFHVHVAMAAVSADSTRVIQAAAIVHFAPLAAIGPPRTARSRSLARVEDTIAATTAARARFSLARGETVR